MKVSMFKVLAAVALLAQLAFAGAAFAEQEDLDNYNKATSASPRNAGVDLYGY